MSRARAFTSFALSCALLAGSATVAQAQPTSCAGADTPAAAGNETQLDQATLCLLNEQRASMGLAALTENHQLDQTSTAFSRQMVAESFFDHTSPEGETLVDRLTAIGYLPGQGSWSAGENIAWGQGTLATPRSIMVSWMNSPGHRANILSAGFSDVGVGVVLGAPVGGSIPAATYTTDFGRHVSGSGSVSLSPYQHPAPSVTVHVVPKPKAKRHGPVIRCARTASTGHSTAHVTHGMRMCRTTRHHARAKHPKR